MKMKIDLEQLRVMRTNRSLDMEAINYYFHSPLDAINFLIDEIDEVESDKIDDLKGEISSLEEKNKILADDLYDLESEIRDLEKEVENLRGKE